MVSVLIILLISVAVECQECNPCPDMCTCRSYKGLDCTGVGVTSIAPGLCKNGAIEDVYFPHNNIAVINWQHIPRLSGRYCDINLQANRIHASLGILVLEECHSFDLDLSHNRLTTLPTDFFIANGDFTFVDILLMHNSITDIMPGAIKINSSSNFFFDVDLTFNMVSHIHPGAFDVPVNSKFYDLILKNNNIVSFSILSAWRSVTNTPLNLDLDLRNNLIEDLEVEDEDKEYGFSYSRINVMLENNPWNCDCNHRRVAFDNSNQKRLFQPFTCYQPTCGTPDVVRNISVLSLSLEDFTCPPRLDSITNVTFIEISPGRTANLICPVTYADPPITHYDWTFSPKLPVTEPKLFGAELWDIRFIRRTSSNHIEVENVQLEGEFECRAVSPGGTLSVHFSVSFPQSQTTVASGISKNSNFVTSYSVESTTTKILTASVTTLPMPVFSVTVLSTLCCVASVLLLVTFLSLCVVSVKYFSLRRSQQITGRDTYKVTTNPKQKSLHQTYEIVYKVSNNATADNEDYLMPSNTLLNKATCSNEGYVNFTKYQNKPTPKFCNRPYVCDR